MPALQSPCQDIFRSSLLLRATRRSPVICSFSSLLLVQFRPRTSFLDSPAGHTSSIRLAECDDRCGHPVYICATSGGRQFWSRRLQTNMDGASISSHPSANSSPSRSQHSTRKQLPNGKIFTQSLIFGGRREVDPYSART